MKILKETKKKLEQTKNHFLESKDFSKELKEKIQTSAKEASKTYEVHKEILMLYTEIKNICKENLQMEKVTSDFIYSRSKIGK